MAYEVAFDAFRDLHIDYEGGVCVPIDMIMKKDVYCKTYFNYEKNRIICKCQGVAEITGILDYTLANFYKLLQFPEFSTDLITPLSICFLISSLTLIIFFSVLLLILDYLEDRQKMYKPKLTKTQKLAKELRTIQFMKDQNIFMFTFQMTNYSYPFFEVIFNYDFRFMRFIRFQLQVINCLASLLFFIFLYYKQPFELKQIFMDKRDIEEENMDIGNLPLKIVDFLTSIVYSLAASIVMALILFVVKKLLNFGRLLLKIWLKREKLIENYFFTSQFGYSSFASNIFSGFSKKSCKSFVLVLEPKIFSSGVLFSLVIMYIF